MGKPSIFSKDYDKHRKKRKKRLYIIIVLALISAGILLTSGSIKNKISTKVSNIKNIKSFSFFKKNEKDSKQETNIKEKEVNEITVNNETEKVTEEEKGYDISLNSGKIKAIYETMDGVNKFKYIQPANSSTTYSINPSGNLMIVFEKETQNMILIDISGNIQDITKNKYVDSENNKTIVYNKEDVLKKHKKYNYVWCDSPKFIDDENIVYFSQLPHISRKISTKFLWAVNIKNIDNHINKYSLKGENLRLGNTTDKGIELIMDSGTIKFVKVSKGVIKVNE